MGRTSIDRSANGRGAATKKKAVRKARIDSEDARVNRAIFTLREAAGYLGIPKSTLQHWARGGASRLLVLRSIRRSRRDVSGSYEEDSVSSFSRTGQDGPHFARVTWTHVRDSPPPT